MKDSEYRIRPDNPSESSVRLFELIYSIVDQEEIPPEVRLNDLFPVYILKKDISNSRKRFIRSFFFPVSKKKWRTLYNMNSIGFGRNFYKGTKEVGTEAIKISDRRYKKGYRTEWYGKFEKVFMHHLYLPWTKLSEETKIELMEEFELIKNKVIKNYKIGRIVIPFILGITILSTFLFSESLFLFFASFALFLVVIFRYIISEEKLEKRSMKLAKEIEHAYENQDEYLMNRFLPYSEIRYENLEEIKSVASKY